MNVCIYVCMYVCTCVYIATAITGKSIGGQTGKSGIGSQQQFDSRTSVVRRNNLQEYESRRDKDRQSRKRQSKQSKPEILSSCCMSTCTCHYGKSHLLWEKSLPILIIIKTLHNNI